jgi:hypothetical protein
MKRALIVSLVVVFLGSLAWAAQQGRLSVRNLPPVVVKAEPQAGDTKVDPAVKEIRVTFSKDMVDKSWSWTQISKENYPEVTGAIRYLEDKRTCVLPVKLQPGTTYAILLNPEKYKSFRDTDGQAAMAYLLVFETRQ